MSNLVKGRGQRLIPEYLLKYLENQKENGVNITQLVDSKGNPRFIEGNGTPLQQEGVTISYCKWSLSGTHLMLVVGGTVESTTVINAAQLGQFYLPKYISDKIAPTFSNRVEIKSLIFYANDFSSQNVNCSLAIDNINNKAVILTHGSLTLSADRGFRIQFDLLIDSE